MAKQKKGFSVTTLRRVLRYIRPRLPRIAFSLLFSLVSAALTLYVPILVGRAIDTMIAAGKVDFAALAPLLLRIGLCVAGTSLSQWGMGMLNNRITYDTVRDLRHDAFAHLHQLPLSYLDAHASGDILSRMIADVDVFADGLLLGFSQLFTGVVTILGTLIFMLTLSPLITLVVVVLTPLSLFVARFIASRTYNMFLRQSETRGEQTSLINEAIGEMKLIRAFSREEATLEQFDEINGRLRDCSLQATFFSSLVNPATRFVNALVYAAVALAGSLAVLGGGLTVGALTSFLSYATQYARPFNEISCGAHDAGSGRARPAAGAGPGRFLPPERVFLL